MLDKKETLSIVVPVYHGLQSLPELYARIKNSVENHFSDFELILVNDACPHGSWDLIKELCSKDKRVKGINLSRNFGQHYAIMAGLTHVTGDWVVVMDCDLQDRPEEIPALYHKACEGYDSVYANREDRQDSWLRRFQSKLFYKIFGFLTGTDMDSSVSNFGIYRKKVIDSVLKMGDAVKFFPTMVQWVGFKKAFIVVQHDERKHGRSSYSFFKLVNLAIGSIISFANRPLELFVGFGFMMTIIAFATSAIYFGLALMGYFRVEGFASLILSIWTLSGIIILEIGIVGVYLGKVFDQTKGRPRFIVSESLNVVD